MCNIEKFKLKHQNNSYLDKAEVTFVLCGILLFLCQGILTKFQSEGAAPFDQFILFSFVLWIINKLYTTWLNFLEEHFEDYRVYSKRKVAHNEDKSGRTNDMMKSLEYHSVLTVLSDWTLGLLSWMIAGDVFWPALNYSHLGFLDALDISKVMLNLGLVLVHLYTISFFMYWLHRVDHEVPFLWKHIHSVHHWAYRPHADVTFDDHWLDNVLNALCGNYLAQFLVPLPATLLICVRVLRILESLEKHSGLSGWFNIAYSVQAWLPFAQQPEHHDWHHSGYKSSNYSFSAVGGIWDVLFETRQEPPKKGFT